ncbi:DUF1499 domain-containing protein [Chamaesiphon sp. VAR_48_metabat_403]|uniref:DUF1499 domain-containing protein n=1 Tax=Chamaesiphon sp. VAR_48_metabat_403 TaxID=2964700 RepID=UPI00286E565B|nr:DUF1499 domain-containing protein [Chamaesiphon sp. VAR_48_metabat_403]
MNTVKSKPIARYVVMAIALILAFLFWNNHIFAGTAPTNIGVENGKLTVCPATPNCVNSQVSINDSQKISPIQFTGDIPTTIAKLKQTIASMPRTNIVKETNNYLYVEFASKLMGFVDDVEFYFDNDNKLIQVRSASRLGESDLGVNRQRIEEIRTLLAAV